MDPPTFVWLFYLFIHPVFDLQTSRVLDITYSWIGSDHVGISLGMECCICYAVAIPNHVPPDAWLDWQQGSRWFSYRSTESWATSHSGGYATSWSKFDEKSCEEDALVCCHPSFLLVQPSWSHWSYPAIYIVCTLPNSASRWMEFRKLNPSYQFVLGAQTLYSLSGLFNFFLFLFTRPSWVIGSRRREERSEPLRGHHGILLPETPGHPSRMPDYERLSGDIGRFDDVSIPLSPQSLASRSLPHEKLVSSTSGHDDDYGFLPPGRGWSMIHLIFCYFGLWISARSLCDYQEKGGTTLSRMIVNCTVVHIRIIAILALTIWMTWIHRCAGRPDPLHSQHDSRFFVPTNLIREHRKKVSSAPFTLKDCLRVAPFPLTSQ